MEASEISSPQKSVKSSMRRFAVATFCIAVAGIAATCLLASIIPALEPVTELAPWTAATAAVAGLAGLAARKWIPSWSSICCLASSAILAVAFGPAQWRAVVAWKSSPGAVELRVMSLNFWFENPDTERLLDLIEQTDPDIIVLTEAGESALIRLSAGLSEYPSRFTCGAMPYCGVAIFSRLSGRPLPGGADLADGLTRPPGDWGVIPMAAAEFQLPDGEWFPVAAAHALRRGGVAADAASMSAVAQMTMGLPRKDLAILAGDFNSPDWSWTLRRLEERIPLQRRTFGVRTWPAPSSPLNAGVPAAVFGIDHVFAGRGWLTVSVERGPDVGSDHYPVLSAFRRAAERLPDTGE